MGVMGVVVWFSYGGHYAPELSAYILQQNQRITTQVRHTHAPVPSIAWGEAESSLCLVSCR